MKAASALLTTGFRNQNTGCKVNDYSITPCLHYKKEEYFLIGYPVVDIKNQVSQSLLSHSNDRFDHKIIYHQQQSVYLCLQLFVCWFEKKKIH